MESSRMVVDTNIFSDYLRAKDKKNTDLYNVTGASEIKIRRESYSHGDYFYRLYAINGLSVYGKFVVE